MVGWSMRPDMHRSLVIDALEMGVYQRRPQLGGLILHSDRGSQYASEDFRAVIDKGGLVPSFEMGLRYFELIGRRFARDDTTASLKVFVS
jgi:transposase InsO family protein